MQHWTQTYTHMTPDSDLYSHNTRLKPVYWRPQAGQCSEHHNQNITWVLLVFTITWSHKYWDEMSMLVLCNSHTCNINTVKKIETWLTLCNWHAWIPHLIISFTTKHTLTVWQLYVRWIIQLSMLSLCALFLYYYIRNSIIGADSYFYHLNDLDPISNCVYQWPTLWLTSSILCWDGCLMSTSQDTRSSDWPSLSCV